MRSRHQRQAVVIIHGIGEQRPTLTARSFARSIKGDDDEIYFAPYPTDEPTDLRLYKLTWGDSQLGLYTDIYEAYWAFRFRDTAVSHIWNWLVPMLRTRVEDVPERLSGNKAARRHKAIGSLLIAAFLTMIALSLVGIWVDKIEGPWFGAGFALLFALLIWAVWLSRLGIFSILRTSLLALTIAFIGIFVLLIRNGAELLALFSLAVPPAATYLAGRLTAGVGDAARYLRASPDNYSERLKIRRIVINLLRDLHTQRDKFGGYKYDRIVVIGHSLGSVIGYEAIRHYWTRVNARIGICNDTERSGFAEDLDVATAALNDLAEDRSPDIEELNEAHLSYRSSQSDLFGSIRTNTEPPEPDEEDLDIPPARWIVSDFVTLGCPLAHIDFLAYASEDHNIFSRQREREYPTCPPQLQQPPLDKTIRWQPTNRDGEDNPWTFFHHSASFAPTRWTNLYFGNDLIGGPVAPLFGAGVHDILLPPRGSESNRPSNALRSYSHSSYWPSDSKPQKPSVRQGSRRSLIILKSLIRRTEECPDGVPIFGPPHWEPLEDSRRP